MPRCSYRTLSGVLRSLHISSRHTKDAVRAYPRKLEAAESAEATEATARAYHIGHVSETDRWVPTTAAIEVLHGNNSPA